MNSKIYDLVYQAPLRTAFAIRTNDGAIAETLCLQYGKDVTKGKPRSACKQVEIFRTADGFRVNLAGESHATVDPLTDVSSIVFSHTEYDPSVLALHGAAVAHAGKVYLFLAATGGGKTTLVSYLVSCGFDYLTDDCILLDRTDFTVHPAPKPVHLRRGGLEILRTLGKAPPCRQIFSPPGERYVYTPKTVVQTPLPLGAVYFLHRTTDRNAVEEIPVNQRIEALMKSPITQYDITGEYLRLLLRLAKTDCRALYYRDMDYVRTLIEKEDGDGAASLA